MNDKLAPRFFLGANSATGFKSFFEDALAEENINQKYIFKGGAGCGKSTAMRQIVINARENGLQPEMIHCSSDPHSLDGVILRQKHCAFFDGTAPHSIDLQFPFAEGEYIFPQSMANQADLQKKLPVLQEINAKLKNHYAEVFHITSAAGSLAKNVCFRVGLVSDTAKLAKRADGIISREIPKGNGIGRKYKRFLSGITPEGPICFFDTAAVLANKIYAMNDSFGFSKFILEPILQAATQRGYNVYACYSPLLPDCLEHIIIPQLSLAFITCSKNQKLSFKPYRKINLDGVLDVVAFHEIRPQIRLMQKISHSLILDACEILGKTKELHDELENAFHPHLNYEALSMQTQTLINNVH